MPQINHQKSMQLSLDIMFETRNLDRQIKQAVNDALNPPPGTQPARNRSAIFRLKSQPRTFR